MNAICIGCGCDEQHGCQVDVDIKVAPTCWWLRFDAEARVGVCSACSDLARVWDTARQRMPLWSLIAERFYRQAMPVYEGKANALSWLASPQPLLHGAVPRELLIAGELRRVRDLLDCLSEGVYL